MNVISFKLRDATIDDLDDLVSMRLNLQHHIEEKNSLLWKISGRGIQDIRELYIECVNNSDSKLVVAYTMESGLIIGMGLGRSFFQEKYVPGKSGRIDDIWIEPQFRRQGICTKIVQEIMTYFKSQEIGSVILDYIVGDEIAEKTWSKFGFNPLLATAVIYNQ